MKYTDSFLPFSWKRDVKVLPELHHIKVVDYDGLDTYVDEKAAVKIL